MTIASSLRSHLSPMVFAALLATSACRSGESEPCTTDDECAAELICHNGACTRPAQEGAACDDLVPCRKELACVEGKCVAPAGKGEGCLSDEYCANGLACHNGQCFGPVTKGQDCKSDWACVSGLVCAFDKCSSPAAVEAPCKADHHCQKGLKCLGDHCFKPRPAGEACDSAAQCEAGLLCFEQKCAAPLSEGQKCKSGEQCVQGLECIRSVCFKRRAKAGSCEYDEQCTAGLSCYQGICFRKKDEGGRCESDGECKSGLSCRKLECYRRRAQGKSCGEDDECAEDLWCLRETCIQRDEKLEGLFALWSTWKQSKTVDCWKASRLDVLSYDACDDIKDAMLIGRTSRSGRTAMKEVLKNRGINKIKGYMVARLGDNLFEAKLLSSEYDWGIGLSSHKRFLLTTVVTDFYTTGVFRIWVERMPSESIRTTSGAYEFWPSYKESLIGTAYQIVRDARAGDDTAAAAKEFMEVIIVQTFLSRLVEVGAKVDSPL